MKLCRYGEPGEERPALIDESGVLRSLTGVIGDVSPKVLAPARLASLVSIGVEIGVHPHFACRTRARRSLKPALPNMVRLIILRRLICPSTGLVVQGVCNAA
ncbi:hypothetical protein AA0498_1469 [Acidomonas methanolica]|uniref:Uncharacterized protein n=1 Tax=Acidomonas methanolica NBRC 104435 TaxID=1231351 RepID=A0A023D9H1_ACIMT|nr:hypothetical protein EDC31_14113 [Acidomonas methanolica]GAJ30774.1 hypothetical protein Amme_328_013 [Acidomonas methanolica NBRC 104435]GBQ51421.1 hypothetical protein AA0498_1469 [Acidomonas methanolica]GEL00468.1 hypothetical protein AME01nite_29660 [Acidomonas methanolica NBRC 104435]